MVSSSKGYLSRKLTNGRPGFHSFFVAKFRQKISKKTLQNPPHLYYNITREKRGRRPSSNENKLIYTIDIEMDVVDKITFTGGQAQGEIRFSYLQETEKLSREFAAPRQRSSAGRQRNRLGIAWLWKFVNGKW